MTYRTLVYDETEPRHGGGFVQYDRVNATAGYVRHFSNLLYLEFISSNPGATWQERAQAEREMIIAKRKMEYHHRHPNFDRQAAEGQIAQIKKDWKR